MAMNVSQNQRGVSIIAVVATMLILSVMGVVLVTMVTTGSDISVNQLRSEQSFNIASGGVEYGLYTTTRGGGSWGEFTFSNRPLGAGSFTLTTNTSIIGTERRMALESTGSVTSPMAARKVKTEVRRGASGATILSEPFPAGSVPSEIAANSCTSNPALSWCYSYTNNQGTSLYDGTQNAPGSTGGSLLAQTYAAGSNDQLIGYRQKILSSALSSGSGIGVIVKVAYRKSGANVNTNTISIRLFDSAASVETTLWSDLALTTAGWVSAQTSMSLPAGRTYDRIRLYFNLREQGNNQVSTWFDEVSLTTGSGTIPVSIVNWQEIYQ